jgi:hypothetical protein
VGVEPILTKATMSKNKEIHFGLKFRTSKAIYMIGDTPKKLQLLYIKTNQ